MQTVKCVLLGDSKIGKTCMLISYTENKFPQNYVPTVFDNYSANIMIEEEPINLNLWDTAGDYDSGKLITLAFPQTNIFFLVYSLTSIKSLKNLEEYWCPLIKKHCLLTPFILVGTQLDLKTNVPEISQKVLEHTINKLKPAGHYECSSFTQENLNHVFKEGIKIGLKNKLLQLNSKTLEKPDSCCLIL